MSFFQRHWSASSFSARRFVMLQGPHGPFFNELAAALRSGGGEVFRIGFNRGDAFYWQSEGFTAFHGHSSVWRGFFTKFIAEHGITDLIVYGDTRFHHVRALEIAKAAGLRIHVFEEGYLRPFWATYERNGVNGHSKLMDISIDDMRHALTCWDRHTHTPPATWGELPQHIFYGAVYHALVMMGMRRFANYKPHRQRKIEEELRSNVIHLAKMPVKFVRRWMAQRRIKRGKFAYSLVLLQLAHDASIQHHSSFRDMISVIRLTLQEFARAAKPSDHLVFKAHPLEDYFHPLAEYAMARAAQLGIRDRVHFIEGGKLAELLDQAQSVVTVNSTAAQQALWRNLPVKALGRAVYSKPTLVSDQALAAFFQEPKQPSSKDYDVFYRFMLETSQFRGGFYSVAGRAMLIRAVVPAMMDDTCPYEKLFQNALETANVFDVNRSLTKVAALR